MLADQGTCCIDEFDKMGQQHQALLEAMVNVITVFGRHEQILFDVNVLTITRTCIDFHCLAFVVTFASYCASSRPTIPLHRLEIK